MWAAIGKFLVKSIPPEKIIKIVLGSTFGTILFIGLLFSGPGTIYKHVPLGQSPTEFGYYQKGAQHIESDTGVLIGWQKIMAIDAVVLQQDFSTSSEGRAYGYKSYFIREEVETIPKTCTREVSGGVLGTVTIEEYDCSETITVYYERDFDQVLSMLVADGTIRADQVEDVKDYNIVDLSPLIESEVLPPGWMPIIHDFNWPLPGVYKITSTFGARIDPVTFDPAMHNGMDIGAPTGTDVLAAKDGKVLYAKYMGSAGNAVIIQHENDTQTCYFHLSRIVVKAGQVLKQNQKIGLVGSTGKSTGSHLHFEFRVAGVPVSPLTYFQ